MAKGVVEFHLCVVQIPSGYDGVCPAQAATSSSVWRGTLYEVSGRAGATGREKTTHLSSGEPAPSKCMSLVDSQHKKTFNRTSKNCADPDD